MGNHRHLDDLDADLWNTRTDRQHNLHGAVADSCAYVPALLPHDCRYNGPGSQLRAAEWVFRERSKNLH